MSTRSPSWTAGREVRPTERDPVEDVEVAAEDELGVAAGGVADAWHGEAEDGHQRLGVPGAERRQAREVAVQPVVDERGGQRQVDRAAAGADPPARRRAAAARNRSTNACQRSAGSSKPAAAAWPPWRISRSAQRGERPREVERPSPRHEARTIRAEVRPDDRGQAGLVGDAPGDEPDDAHRPRPADEARRPRRASDPTAVAGRPRPLARLVEQRLLAGRLARLRQAERGPCLARSPGA